MRTKKCSTCRKYKPRYEFSKNKAQKDGLCNICKICDKRKKKAYTKKHRVNIKESGQDYHAREQGFEGIKDRDKFIESRNSQCEVCGITREFSKKFLKIDLCVDHCHINGDNKGVLCRPCNLASGGINDNPNRAYLLWQYLKRTRETV